jgi:phosphatidylserine/phosphatidylglycerophosphate/cardiolipin synthase-like enzyme
MGESYFKTWTDFDALLEGPIVTSVAKRALEVLERSNPNNRFSKMGDRTVQRAAYNTTLDLIRESVDKAEPRMRAAAQARVDAGETLPRFQLVFHDPIQAPGAANPVTDALVDTFRAAKSEVLATSNYVNPVAPIREAAVEASLRGVQTLFTSTSEEASRTSALPALNAAIALEALFSAGARVCETNRQEHGKMYVADRKLAAFGSYNLEHPAHDRLVEALLFTDDKKTVDVLHDAIMDTADNRSKPFEPDTKQRGFFQRIGLSLRKFAARLILPFA